MAKTPVQCPDNVLNRTEMMDSLLADKPQWVRDYMAFLFDPTIPSFVCMLHIPKDADKPNIDSLTVTEDPLLCLWSDAFNCKTIDELHAAIETFAPMDMVRGVCGEPASMPLYSWGRVWSELFTKEVSEFTPETRIGVYHYDDFMLADKIFDQGVTGRQMWEMVVHECFPHVVEEGGIYEGRTIPTSPEEARTMYGK